MLTIETGALDPRVTGIAALQPAYCDVAAELHGRASGWPRPFHRWTLGKPSPHEVPEQIKTTQYYDTVNFARRLQVPGFYS